jgi:putative heme-binding domain-containing protein
MSRFLGPRLGVCCSLFFSCFAAVALAQDATLKLEHGDHITLIGNTLADRMQHDGWLEAYVQARFPDKELVFRNISFPGDEIDNRPRSENFGSPQQWLSKTKTDVVIAMFGYNESFAGEAGLAAFKQKLEKLIDTTLAAKYGDRGNARLVLVSPIAHEDLKSPHLPDGKENNARLALYTKAMGEVAKAKKVPFVDLFSATQKAYTSAKVSLTINGVHLTNEGNRVVAEAIDRQLFGDASTRSATALEALRQAVVNKDYYWWNLYRTVDGYNVFGGRSKLEWFGQSNFDVLQREMDIFNAMTANRDKHIWAIAQGKKADVSDANLPEYLEVKTNIPGPLPGGKHQFLGGVEGIGKMKIAKGMEVNLFASEETFPDLINPVQMAVDTDGRLWAATWPSYPHGTPSDPHPDKLLIFPDEDRDGKADKAIIFAENLNSVTGFEFWGGGVIVAAAPELLFLKDTDGDDQADLKIRILNGISAEDTHHTANALTIGPDGWLYFSHGIFHVDNQETPTRTFRSQDSGVFRFNPRTYEVEFHHPIGPNPHGIAFDQWGFQFATDGTGGTGHYVSIGHGVGPAKNWYPMRVRPVPAIGFLSSEHFPSENQGNFLICNAIGVLGVLQHTVSFDGADINATEIEPLLLSSDPNFRPSDIEVAGDGALYIADWCNPIVGHMQHNIRDPNRDHSHGRIYRMTAKGRDLVPPRKMKGKPLPEVLSAFYAKDNGTRYRARLELSGRKTDEVVAALANWTKTIEPKTSEHEQALLEALWVHEEHRVPNESLLAKVFAAKDPRVRAAAVRTLGHWAGKVKTWQPTLIAAARDADPLVRAEAAKAAVYFGGLPAAEVIFEVAIRPSDVQLDHVLNYAKSKVNIDQIAREALEKKQPLSLAGQTYLLRNASVADLLKMDRSEAVYLAILSRSNVPAENLREALKGLADFGRTDQTSLAIKMLVEQDGNGQDSNLATLARLLAEQPVATLAKFRGQIEKLASQGKTAGGRRAGYAAWAVLDNGIHNALAEAGKSKPALRDLLESLPLVSDAKLQAQFFEPLRTMMFELPPNLARESASATIGESGIQVDFFHPSAADVAIETLARLKPKASGIVPQIVMDVPQLKERDAFALRFTGQLMIDKPGKYTFYIASDDGSRIYLDKELLVNNDGLHGMVEKQATIELPTGPHALIVTYFDNGGGDGLAVNWSGPGFDKQPIPTAKLSVGSPESLHDVAIRAVAALPGKEKEKFEDFTSLIAAGRNRTTAISALQKVSLADTKKEKLQSLADNLVALLSEIPANYRNGVAATEAMTLARKVADALPAADGESLRKRLENLDVRVIAIGATPHRMIFDKEIIAAQAGKPIEIRFANGDDMPHNFAIVKPGALVEVGELAEATARSPDAMERHYVPKSDSILIASRLLRTGEAQAITFEVPTEPGIYPYVCTYPGHWRRMYGALYVVADLRLYEADPASYLAANPLPMKDELLARLGRNTEWKFEDLAGAVEELSKGHSPGRSFEVGKQLFKTAACISCHKLGDEGRNIGPDLAKLDEKRTMVETLRDIVEPSWRINEKFESFSIETEDGKISTGLIVKESADEIELVSNPLAPDKPTKITVKEIAEREKSKLSLMPQGVLNKLTQEEILDLLAYVFAKGDQKHKLFEEHHHH